MSIITKANAAKIIETGNPLPETVIQLPDVWRADGPDGYERDVLAGIWRIGSLSMHVTALAVVLVCGVDEEGNEIEVQWDDENAHAADMELSPAARQMFNTSELWRAHAMEGHAETIEIDGMRYVVFASSFCT